MSSEDAIFIPNGQLLTGAFRAWSNARYFLEISNSLYSSKTFQAAVPLTTIAFEECQKGIELLNRFRRNQNMTRNDWNNMRNHKHKLIHVTKEATDMMEKATPKEDAKALKELRASNFPVPDMPKKEIIEINKRLTHLHSQFQNLREQCLYTDWNEMDADWVSFSRLSEDRQNALAFFVLSDTKSQIEYLEYYLEKIVNKLREEGTLKGSVPYPRYTEHRTPDKFESIKNFDRVMSKTDQIRFNQGILTMQKFISLNSFEKVSFGLLRDTMTKYLKLIQKQDDDKWFPHPLIKALMLAIGGARNGENDGNYYGISDDANLTLEGKPFMVIIVIIGKKGEIFTIEKIASVGNEDHAFPADMIERILRTETILERDAGKNASVPNFIEALSVVGMKSKMIREDELDDAISYTKKMTSEGRLENVPSEIIEEIKNKGREHWDDMMPETRSMVVSTYGPSKYSDYQMFSIPTRSIPKLKARLIIMEVLQSKYFSAA